MISAEQVALLLQELAELREENALLRAENLRLTQQAAAKDSQIADLCQSIVALQQQLAALATQLEQLPNQPTIPDFVKPHAKAQQPKVRRKRDPAHNRARRRQEPTRSQQHAADNCHICGYQLRGKAIARTHQVIELPPPAPVDVVDHQIIKRWCPRCERFIEPKQPLAGIVLGNKGRFGVRIAALIAHLRYSLRLPVRLIVTYLGTMHKLTLSTGEVIYLLKRMHKQLAPQIAALRSKARASPILHGDETSWREGGQNGYVWLFCTPDEAGPDVVRYYEYDHSRGQDVVKRLLHSFSGLLNSDFLASYNIYGGKHQRCWVHLLRDLHELKETHKEDAAVLSWAEQLRALYDDAQAFIGRVDQPSQAEREVKYVELVGRTHALGLEYCETKRYKAHPCHALSKRLLRHEDELYQYILVAGASSNNNAAERSIRPLVVVRKISAGSRSSAGTKVTMGIFSLLETWRVRGLNPFEELLKLLQNPPPDSIQIPLPQL